MSKFFSLFLFLITLSLLSCQKDPVVKYPPEVSTDGHLTDSLMSSEDNIKLTGSATDRDGQVVAYLWSLVSGPTVAQIETPGLPQTEISMVNTGRYIFQLMATDNEGYTGVAFDTVDVFVKQKQLKTLVLQPANNSEEVIIFGNSSGFDQTNNQTPELCAGEWTYNLVPSTFRSLFKFDMSAISSKAEITGAYLSLYSNPSPKNGNGVDANYGTDNLMLIQRVANPWVGASVTYANQPAGTTQDQVVIPSTTQSMLDLTDVDVTPLVKTMFTGTNYGFIIQLQTKNYYNDRDFCSSRWPDATKHPKLVIQYLE